MGLLNEPSNRRFPTAKIDRPGTSTVTSRLTERLTSWHQQDPAAYFAGQALDDSS